MSSLPFWWGFVCGLFVCAGMAWVLWWQHRKKKRLEAVEFRRVVESNLATVFQEGPSWSTHWIRSEGEGIGPLLDDWLPRLRVEHQETRRQLRQLQIVLESMNEGVLAVDSRQRMILANPAVYPLLGIDLSGMGRFLPELIRNKLILDYTNDALKNDRSHDSEVQLNIRDQVGRTSVRMIAVRITPIKRHFDREGSKQKTTGGAVLVAQDITELRRLERMRQDFVTNASHELKTPLASISLYVESLLDWALEDPEHNRAFLVRIEEQTQRLTNLVTDMLSLSKLESGEDLFKHVPSRIEPILRNRVSSYLDKAESKSVALELKIEGDLRDVMVFAAEEAVRQILDNLIDNAIKYTSEGGCVEVQVGSKPGGWLEITVKDNGLGIPRNDLERIFERFYRVDKARSRDMGGTGLGLAIVKHMVASIGGTIGVESQEGKGSTFRFTLPVVKQEQPEMEKV